MLSSLDQIIPECPVCIQAYTMKPTGVPMLLPDCGHTVCAKCLEKLKRQSELKCPECKTKF